MGIEDYVRRLWAAKSTSHNYIIRSYEKSKCHICERICYNNEDLQLHLKYNHPDIPSAPAKCYVPTAGSGYLNS